MSKLVYRIIQRLRKSLGLSHNLADKQSNGSGSVTVIPGSGTVAGGTVSLDFVGKFESYKNYDPVPFNSYDIPHGIGRVTREYNDTCARVGLQSVVRMDPQDFKTIYDYKNVGRMLVRIRWYEDKLNHEVLLEPGESTILKLGSNLHTMGQYPEIKAFHHKEDE